LSEIKLEIFKQEMQKTIFYPTSKHFSSFWTRKRILENPIDLWWALQKKT